ncbi:hypothetical protein KL953_33670 [Mycolicibacterium goodii]|jgi:hypothetical protein|uniref:Uncharacterized protein n=1 Tax=Mycolicibacterium obuense TaxID=1807 RepID=A0A0J6VQY2_9MYCO|nr:MULTISPECIES: hypothetical protein [Mycobacteriaceae]KMO71892.1 hypothetical protein MOBUDSM44075_04178 [Mycolicibacterium obuense]MBU8813818.1 hypothetical protein [Mycolicibacterium goodii]
MAYELIEAAQTRGRAVNAPHLVALVHTAYQEQITKIGMFEQFNTIKTCVNAGWMDCCLLHM